MPYIPTKTLRDWRKELDYLSQFEDPKPEQEARIAWLRWVLDGEAERA